MSAARAGTMYATVTVNVVGFHNWPGATGRRAYLAERHRHVFVITCLLQVRHDERDVEYHDLQDVLVGAVRQVGTPSESVDGGLEFGGKSCETIARELVRAVRERFPNRTGKMQVTEDNEVGAVLLF